jgi:hypothetical protein
MLLTEEQARMKWCPHAMTATTMTQHPSFFGVGSGNRGYRTGTPYETCRCIASECMAWRWHDGIGFCGLAGKAEA